MTSGKFTGSLQQINRHPEDERYDWYMVSCSDWHEVDFSKYKLILRPLRDMTPEEAKELYCMSPYSKGSWLIKSVIVKENIKGFEPNIVQINWGGASGASGLGYSCGTEYMYFNKLDSEQHKWLLSKHFDVFGLIKAGLAIDKTV